MSIYIAAAILLSSSSSMSETNHIMIGQEVCVDRVFVMLLYIIIILFELGAGSTRLLMARYYELAAAVAELELNRLSIPLVHGVDISGVIPVLADHVTSGLYYHTPWCRTT